MVRNVCDTFIACRYIKLLHELAASEKANVNLNVRLMVLARWHCVLYS